MSFIDNEETYTPSTIELAFIINHLFSLYDDRIEDPVEFTLDFLLAYHSNISDNSKLTILSLFL